jgi:hypothetical protein
MGHTQIVGEVRKWVPPMPFHPEPLGSHAQISLSYLIDLNKIFGLT